jgi:hypothetical protein
LGIAGAAGVAVVLAGCTDNAPPNQAQTNNQNLSNQIEQSASKAVPFPLQQMQQGGWTEEQLLKEHLLRENDPNAVRYVAWLTPQTAQVIQQWTIKGMVFDPNSSMTETQDLDCTTGNTNSAYGCGTVNSPGDNGTYGPEAFSFAFFTTSGQEWQFPTGTVLVEADAPFTITGKPLITYDANQAPSTNYGGVSKIGGK